MGSPEEPPKSQRLPGVHFFPIRQIPKVPSASHPKVPVLLSIFCKAKTLKHRVHSTHCTDGKPEGSGSDAKLRSRLQKA